MKLSIVSYIVTRIVKKNLVGYNTLKTQSKATLEGIAYKSINLELKAAENEEGVIEGYGATFGNQDQVGDIIAPGAFTKAIRKNNRGELTVKMLWQHECDEPIGVWNQLQEDEKGLKVKGRIITKTAMGNDAYELVKGGAIDSLSIGFIPLKWDIDAKKNVRVIQEIELYEISLVTFPANTKAKISSVKSLPEDVRSFEKFLCDAGYSRSQAKRYASGAFKQRDVGISHAIKSLDKTIDQFNSTLKEMVG